MQAFKVGKQLLVDFAKRFLTVGVTLGFPREKGCNGLLIQYEPTVQIHRRIVVGIAGKWTIGMSRIAAWAFRVGACEKLLNPAEPNGRKFALVVANNREAASHRTAL